MFRQLRMCHPQGARLYLLSYMPIWVLVDKFLCSMWYRVNYTEFYQSKPKLACNSEGIDELPEDDT
jgi:hypothetical protein